MALAAVNPLGEGLGLALELVQDRRRRSEGHHVAEFPHLSS
jgi:hypothetical protein